MRQGDTEVHEKAVERQEVARKEARQETVKFWAGIVIAAAGLVVAFLFKEVYLGFGAAMIGTGIIPVSKIPEIFKR
jgi:hypothetical protein